MPKSPEYTRLSAATMRMYLQNPGHCPYCQAQNSDIFEGQPHSSGHIGDPVSISLECSKCGRRWSIYFKIKGVLEDWAYNKPINRAYRERMK